jgi:hypothetical protein
LAPSPCTTQYTLGQGTCPIEKKLLFYTKSENRDIWCTQEDLVGNMAFV